MTAVIPQPVRTFTFTACARLQTDTAYHNWYVYSESLFVHTERERIVDGNSIRAGRITAYQLTSEPPPEAVRKDTK